jgi:hypothetical protein
MRLKWPVQPVWHLLSSTRERPARGIHIFEVLEGRATKHLARPHLSFAGFVYVLGRLRTEFSSSHEIVMSPVWRRWLLEDRQIRGLFLEADREGLLRFSEAGTTVRIDWCVDGLEEIVRAVA